ncbi:unnamed protein product [Sympodiomycopsis kandeliae]
MVLIHLPTGSSGTLPSNAKDYSQAYYQILRSSRRSSSQLSHSGSGAVLILVSNDLDGICACKLLCNLLIADDIMFRIIPIDGFKTLQKILRQDVYQNNSLHSIVFLNLGSLLSLPEYFSEDSIKIQKEVVVHLIDSHRPWNLDNLFATTAVNDQIWVWDDGDIVSGRLEKEKEAYAALEFHVDSDSDSDSDSGSDSEESGTGSGSESDRESLTRPRKRRRSAGSQAGSSTSDDEAGPSRPRRNSNSASENEDSDADGPTGRDRRRRRRRSPRIKRMSGSERDIYRAILSRYYNRGTGHGMSVSGMMFILAETLGRGENEGLWLAILGLSHQYLSNQIPFDTYSQHANGLASDVIALNPPSSSTSQGSGTEDGVIRVLNDELCFTLYRHWNLESSLYHTSYVAGKLGIWKPEGLLKLKGLLAKMGFSLSHSRQNYNHMPMDLRNSLLKQLNSIAPEYGLGEISLQSFIKYFGFRSIPFSALDMVESLNALLTAATGVKIEVEDEGLVFGNSSVGTKGYASNGTPTSSELFASKRQWHLPGSHGDSSQEERGDIDGNGDEDGDDNTNSGSSSWSRNFFITYSALDLKKSSNLNLLNSSLCLARALHGAILSVGTSLIDKQSIRSLRSFRLVVIKDGPHLDLFSTHPLLLIRLGYWLTDALRDILSNQEEKKRAAKKAKKTKSTTTTEEDEKPMPPLPFVLCALNTKKDSYLTVGLIGSSEYGQVAKNKFGLAFQNAIKDSVTSINANGSPGWFDTTIVEIRREDLAGFVERLHLRA